MDEDMFRAPLQQGMRILDRSKFQIQVPLKAARVFNNKDISRLRLQLERSKDAVSRDRVGTVHNDPDPERARIGMKCIILRPFVESKQEDYSKEQITPAQIPVEESPAIRELVNEKVIDVIPFDLHIDYKYWTYHDIISAILPEDDQGEIPCGFSLVGHVAHLNLRDQYLKYKHLIAEVLMDKNPSVRTVINKIDDVGEENEFRTFKYEVLAGPDDLNVITSSSNCTFKFDYSKVYWNSRLDTEHRRLVDKFNEGDVVCDVMAGIGPFAVPAGKKGCFVWANDLNPDSYASLVDAVKRNKVQDYVKPYNENGHGFIRDATAALAKEEKKVRIMSRPSRKDATIKPEVVKILHQPKTFRHFVMNLPASAISFLPSFIGLYPPDIRALLPEKFELPQIHVYCFSTKSSDNVQEGNQICEEISQQLGHPVYPGKIEDGGVEVWDVRDVAPKKRMFCASFRLPAAVAFRHA